MPTGGANPDKANRHSRQSPQGHPVFPAKAGIQKALAIGPVPVPSHSRLPPFPGRKLQDTTSKSRKSSNQKNHSSDNKHPSQTHPHSGESRNPESACHRPRSRPKPFPASALPRKETSGHNIEIRKSSKSKKSQFRQQASFTNPPPFRQKPESRKRLPSAPFPSQAIPGFRPSPEGNFRTQHRNPQIIKIKKITVQTTSILHKPTPIPAKAGIQKALAIGPVPVPSHSRLPPLPGRKLQDTTSKSRKSSKSKKSQFRQQASFTNPPPFRRKPESRKRLPSAPFPSQAIPGFRPSPEGNFRTQHRNPQIIKIKKITVQTTSILHKPTPIPAKAGIQKALAIGPVPVPSHFRLPPFPGRKLQDTTSKSANHQNQKNHSSDNAPDVILLHGAKFRQDGTSRC